VYCLLIDIIGAPSYHSLLRQTAYEATRNRFVG